MRARPRKLRGEPAAIVLAAILGFTGCGDSTEFVGSPIGGTPGPGGQQPTDATSALCEGISGGAAILWDLYNGIARTDSVLPPPLPTPAAFYVHPNYPPLGFQHPTGWTAESLGGGLHDVGVNLIRNDGSAVYRQQTTTVDGTPASRDVLDLELGGAMAFFGIAGAQVEVVCFNEGTFPAGGGIQVAASNALVRSGNITFVVLASVTPFPGLPTSSVYRKVVAASTAEFSTRAIDTFLAIDFQLLVGDSSNLFDSDGDGWRDGIDAFPTDPTRH